MSSFLKRSIMIAMASAALYGGSDAMGISVTVTGGHGGCDMSCYDVGDRYWGGEPPDYGDNGDGGDSGGGGGDEYAEPDVCKPDTPAAVNALTDALAVKAMPLIRAQDFRNREYGVMIYRDNSGTVRMTGLVTGTARQTTFNFTELGIARSSVIGVVHNHPEKVFSSNPIEAQINLNPSAGDWETADQLVIDGVDSMELQLYVLGPDNVMRQFEHQSKEQYLVRGANANMHVVPGPRLPTDLVAPECP